MNSFRLCSGKPVLGEGFKKKNVGVITVIGKKSGESAIFCEQRDVNNCALQKVALNGEEQRKSMKKKMSGSGRRYC